MTLSATSTTVVICFQISIFAESYTPCILWLLASGWLWFAFKLVSLQSHIHLPRNRSAHAPVVICFQISIFAESYTPQTYEEHGHLRLWFAFKLVSLQSHIHRRCYGDGASRVVICFQISIFAESYTPLKRKSFLCAELWFAFKLVSLQSHIHQEVSSSEVVMSCDLLSN